MWQALIATDPQWTSLILRLALGIMILPHGAQKLLGWFGGPGFSGAMGYLTQHIGAPYIFALLAILAEFFGGLGLIFGLFGRVAAFGVGAVMLVAALTVHRRHGFFMNWTGKQEGQGYEFHLLAIAMAIVIVITGSGALSLDAVLFDMLGGNG